MTPEPQRERSYLEMMAYYERLDRVMEEWRQQLERAQWTGLFPQEVRLMLREWQQVQALRG